MNTAEKRWNRNGFTVRAAKMADLDAVVDLVNAAALVDTGMMITNHEDKLIEWGLPQFNMETDTLLLLAADGQAAGGQPVGGQPVGGQPVGFVELWDMKPHVRHILWGRVHPDHRGQGIGNYLIKWAESRARQSLDKTPPEARVSIHTSAVHQNREAHRLFRARGYSPSRHFFRMLIEMAPEVPPPVPVWPEGVKVRPYVLGQDDRAVHRTLDEAFQDHWGYVAGGTFEEWFHWIEEDSTFDPAVCFLAVVGGASNEQVVGALMARPEWEQDPGMAWIDEIGVLRPWRRQGIGLALLHQAFGEFHRRGRYKVGLGVDGDSLSGATRLYEKAGMHIFRQIDAYEKVLRPGVELSTQSLEE
jgi:mycothiol synthase